MGNLQPSSLITLLRQGERVQFTGQTSVGLYILDTGGIGLRYGRPPWETLGIKRKGIDGRAHKEWNLRLRLGSLEHSKVNGKTGFKLSLGSSAPRFNFKPCFVGYNSGQK